MSVGGADGIRTHDLLDAIEARSQLRHGPTEGQQTIRFYMSQQASSTRPAIRRVRTPAPSARISKLALRIEQDGPLIPPLQETMQGKR
jgi:hypothetical protein